jgi:ribosomal protein L11 methyltransferase
VKTQQKVWFAVDIEAVPEATEAVEFAFNELGSVGTETNDLKKISGEHVRVVGYFEESPDEETVQDELYHALRTYGFTADAVISSSRREIENTDWLAEWKKHWKPTELGRFIIAPPWEAVDEKDRIVIRIEPNMAFGTGTHETTQLCLKAIEENFQRGVSFLDVGTGTGILAIAAAKLSEKSEPRIRDLILACDTDEDAIGIARENAKLNGVDDIEFIVGSITDETLEFDLVCANLTIDVILPLLPLLITKARRALVLSGILVEQEGMIVSELTAMGMSNSSIERSGEWIAVTILTSEPIA